MSSRPGRRRSRRAQQAVELLRAQAEPTAVLVSGGTLSAGAAERIGQYVKDARQKRGNFHSVLILEPDVTTLPDGRFSVTVKQLGGPT